jgi:hypothetical protein
VAICRNGTVNHHVLITHQAGRGYEENETYHRDILARGVAEQQPQNVLYVVLAQRVLGCLVQVLDGLADLPLIQPIGLGQGVGPPTLSLRLHLTQVKAKWYGCVRLCVKMRQTP